MRKGTITIDSTDIKKIRDTTDNSMSMHSAILMSWINYLIKNYQKPHVRIDNSPASIEKITTSY